MSTLMLIATRALTLKAPDGEATIPIRIFCPEEKDGVWFCRYEIDWPRGRKSHEIAGIDAVQSLILTLQFIGIQIYTTDYHHSGNLFYDKPGNGYGFPVPHNAKDVLIGDDTRSF